jgi:hypothetical protein
MELQHIEQLLEKYDLGETSLAEEATLAAFFNQDEVPDHLLHYQALFRYFSHAKHQKFTPQVNVTKKVFGFRNLSIAASVVVLLGLLLNYNSGVHNNQFSKDEIFAYDQTKIALEMLSNNFNKGTSQLKTLEVFSNALQKGEQNITFLNTFNTTTNKIFKINK